MRTFGSGELFYLLLALRWTLFLTIIAFIGGGVAGIIVALVRLSDNRTIRLITGVYTQTIQGLPLLMLLFICYYGSGLFGAEMNATLAAAIALTIHSSAFLGIIWESSLRAIPRAQWESSSALALTPLQGLWYVIAPQAVRLALPSTVGFLVQVVKQTSLASIIGFIDITRAGQLMSNATFEPLKAFGAVAIMYFLICFPLSSFSRWLEKRMGGA